MKSSVIALILSLSAHAMQVKAQGSQTADAINNAWLCQSLKDSEKSLCQSQSSVTFKAAPPPPRYAAQGMDMVDGAVVCNSLDLSNYMYSQINMARHARKSLSPELRRQAALVNGYDEGQEPRLTDYGCVLVPVGTPLTVDPGNYVPIVSGRLANGRPFRGVTLPEMIDR